MTEILQPCKCGCGGESHIDHIYRDVPTEDGTFIEMPIYGCFCRKCGIRLPFKHISAAAAIDEWNAIMRNKRVENEKE